MIEGLPLWVAQTNCWIVAPGGPGGECVIIDAPPDPTNILNRLAHHDLRLVAGWIGRTDMPGGSLSQLMDSMAEKILPMPDEVQVLPGHGQVTTVGWERKTNPFLVELQQRGGVWTD